MEHPDLLSGFAHFEDAGVFRLRADLAIVQTVDFFPPIVNDPRDFGRIAAANALSDVYAMGAEPRTALGVVGFPTSKVDRSVLGEILAAGAEQVIEAGAVVVGGHSVVDAEIKYGLAVTGTIHPDRVVRNDGAQVGDQLVLTKPIGMGAVSTAIKAERINDDAIRRASQIMAPPNRAASALMVATGVNGATDVPGFGFLGHARELAEASNVTLRIEASKVPVFPEAPDLVQKGLVSGGAARNRQYLGQLVTLDRGVDALIAEILFDAETSGGLLISLPPTAAPEVVRELRSMGHVFTSIVGEAIPAGERWVHVTT